MTQEQAVMEYINEHGSISPQECIKHCGSYKLSTLIGNIHNRQGVSFEWIWETGTNMFGKKCRYKRYWIKKED